MAYVSAAPRGHTVAPLAWLSAIVDTVKLELLRRRVYRETYNELAMLTERELADVGLSALMIRDVAHEAARKVRL